LRDELTTLDTTITIVKTEGRIVETTPEELLQDQTVSLDTPIKIVITEEEVITTTPGQLLADRSITAETPIKLVVEEPEEMLTVAELLRELEGEDLSRKTFFIHTVTRDDDQGIWGILQYAITDRFQRGIPLPELVQSTGDPFFALELPRLADEPLADGTSSFLGLVLDGKTRESYVYNYVDGRMGRNPDYIKPGQELVVTHFTQEELIRIYDHFAQRN
jgi:hypothetical protein